MRCRVGSLIVEFEVIFKVQINESLLSLEKAFTDAINGSLLGQVTGLRLSGNVPTNSTDVNFLPLLYFPLVLCLLYTVPFLFA